MKRPEALQQRVQFLKANRLNVVRHINSQPTVLAYCVARGGALGRPHVWARVLWARRALACEFL